MLEYEQGGPVREESQGGKVRDHNWRVRLAWVSGGGDPARQWWWHVTELTLDHFRPSPKWKKENEELELAKECEALIGRGLADLAKHRQKEEEKMRLLREVAELFKTDWPKGGKARCAKRAGPPA